MHLRTINNQISIRKLPIKLVKGKGYFYLVFDNNKLFETKNINVFRLNALTLDQWLKEAVEFNEIMTNVETF